MKIALAADHGGFDAIAFPLTPPKMREIIEVCFYDLSGPMPALLEPRGQFPRSRRFARALQPGHQNHRGRLGGEVEPRGVFAQQCHQFVAHNFDHLLGGRERGKHFAAHGLLADVLDKVGDYLEVDVGLEQSHADFAQCFGDVFFSERALAAKALEDSLQFVGKILKHGLLLVYRTACRGSGSLHQISPRR